jgi:hypothetical protein
LPRDHRYFRLTRAGGVDQPPELLDEEVDPIGLKLHRDQGMWLMDPALHESDGLAHPLQGNPVLTANGRQDVRLHEILKGQ